METTEFLNFIKDIDISVIFIGIIALWLIKYGPSSLNEIMVFGGQNLKILIDSAMGLVKKSKELKTIDLLKSEVSDLQTLLKIKDDTISALQKTYKESVDGIATKVVTIYQTIQQIITDFRKKYDLNKIIILKFHNGIVSSAGHSFKSFSIRHEEARSESTLNYNFQNISLSYISDIVLLMFDHNFVTITKDSEIYNSNAFIRELITQNNLKEVIFIPLWHDGKLFGATCLFKDNDVIIGDVDIALLKSKINDQYKLILI